MVCVKVMCAFCWLSSVEANRTSLLLSVFLGSMGLARKQRASPGTRRKPTQSEVTPCLQICFCLFWKVWDSRVCSVLGFVYVWLFLHWPLVLQVGGVSFVFSDFWGIEHVIFLRDVSMYVWGWMYIYVVVCVWQRCVWKILRVKDEVGDNNIEERYVAAEV